MEFTYTSSSEASLDIEVLEIESLSLRKAKVETYQLKRYVPTPRDQVLHFC